MLAGLPYVVWPIGSLFILASPKKNDPFLLYHAVQGGMAGLLLGGVSFLSLAVLMLVFRVLPAGSVQSVSTASELSVGSAFPGWLGMALFAAGTVMALFTFLTAVFLAWRATEGEMLRLPFIGDFAESKMVDHSGMTRRQFNQMLQNAFRADEMVKEEEIPFPEEAEQQDPVPAKSRTISANLDQVREARAQQSRETRHLGGPPAPPPQPAQRQGFRQGGVVNRALGEAQQSQQPVAKSYPLIGGQKKPMLQPSPTQRSPEPPRRATAAPGWQQQQQAQRERPAPPTPPPGSQSYQQQQQHQQQQGQASPRVRDVDLVRHYQKRKTGDLGTHGAASQGGQQSDVLRQWLSKVDND